MTDLRTDPSYHKDPDAVKTGQTGIFSMIGQALANKKGCLIGRTGTIEFQILHEALQKRVPHDGSLKILERNAGIFPFTRESFLSWIQAYYDACVEADCMAAGWYAPHAQAEVDFLDREGLTALFVPLRSLEPYYVEPKDMWTRILEGHRVTVVTSFAKTAEMQLTRAESIWSMEQAEAMLPLSAKWRFVRSYYSPALAGSKTECQWPLSVVSWMDAVEYLERKIMATNPDVVLLGCGGLAMPLGLRLKRRGIVAVVMGGAIQTLFGIKGKRWKTHPIIGQFWNGAWVSPSQDEIPGNAHEIEGGCYW